MARRIVQYIFDQMIHAIAVVVAAVLTDPSVKEAIANIIVTGVTNFIRQPNLDEHILLANQTLGRTRDTMANKAGEDFPKVVGAFMKGMFLPNKSTAAIHKNGVETGSDKDKLENGNDKNKPSEGKGTPEIMNDSKTNITAKPQEEEDDQTTESLSEEGDDINIRKPASSAPSIVAK